MHTLRPLDTETIAAAARETGAIVTAEEHMIRGGLGSLVARAEIIAGLNALPAGIAPGAQVVNPVSKGSVITWDDVHLDETSTVVKLRREQDALTAVMTPAIA